MPYFLLTNCQLHVRALTAAALGAVLGALIGGLVVSKTTAATEPVVDPRLETGCRWPTAEAESTFVIVIDGKLRCFRYY